MDRQIDYEQGNSVKDSQRVIENEKNFLKNGKSFHLIPGTAL